MKTNLKTIGDKCGGKLWWAALFFIMATVQLVNAQNAHSISGILY